MSDRTPSIWPQLRSAVYTRFKIDTRALEAFRIGLAAVVVLDLVLRARSLTAFYTDAGVLPRSALFVEYPTLYSIHALSGSVAWQVAMFLITAVCAGALLIGYRPKLALFGTLLLIDSLRSRNQLILNAGDTLLYLLLFFGLFLPLGRQWTLTARTDDTGRSAVCTLGTVGILVQIWLVYGVNAVHKLRGDEWVRGGAVYEIFGAGQFTTLIGPKIAELQGLLSALQYVWLGLLVASPLLLLSAVWLRTILVSLLIGGHIGILLTMHVGIFPLVSIVGLILFYPPVVWDWLTAQISKGNRGKWMVSVGSHRRLQRLILFAVPSWEFFPVRGGEYLSVSTADSIGSRLLPSIPGSRFIPSWRQCYQVLANWGRFLSRQVLPVIILTVILLSAAQSVDIVTLPESADTTISRSGFDQSWQMFAPDPVDTEVWFVAPGLLTNGSKVDIYRGGAVDFSRPRRVDTTYQSARWRKYLSNLRSEDNANHRSYFAHYLCRRWDQSRRTDVQEVALYAVERYGRSGNPAVFSRELLTTHDCSGELRQ